MENQNLAALTLQNSQFSQLNYTGSF